MHLTRADKLDGVGRNGAAGYDEGLLGRAALDFRAVYGRPVRGGRFVLAGQLAEVDLDQARELLGDDAAASLEELAKLAKMLEEAGLIGDWLRTKGPEVRDRIVLSTKTFNSMDEGADHGLAPARVRRQVESSLQRLGVERVDMFLAHEWDPDVPVAETAGSRPFSVTRITRPTSI